MLCLNRQKGKKIIIKNGSDIIEIVVIEAVSGNAKIGINAPDNYKIFREELLKSEGGAE